MTSAALAQFDDNMARVATMVALHANLKRQTTAAIDVSDILRACHMMAVSAVDHYIHEIAREGMMQIFDGSRAATPAYHRFRLSMRCLTAQDTQRRSSIEADIREQHSYLSFQQPDKIADAVRLIAELKLWDEVASLMGSTAKDVKDQVVLIVDRRNKIAHEADLDPTYPNTRWPINGQDIEDTISFLKEVILAIDMLVNP
ncbi:MAG: hypothetical protein J0H18_18395 [Rhizobiales bacterium]|nr:hypothetical protein [Hyphomicrobiales bacterium]OJY04825.1 MAG: hypothetical protein BGP07_08950 [Rhizobiales bacterium 63-22]